MTQRKLAQTYISQPDGPVSDTLTLTYEARFLRRKLLVTDSGETVLVDLAQVTSLDHDGALQCEDGTLIGVRAAPEPLLQVTGEALPRLAWHIGNRHTPCQIEVERLLIQQDPVIRTMLAHLDAKVSEVEEPFTPEGGAYGHGRTHAHEHGHSAHSHAPDQPHGHDHAH